MAQDEGLYTGGRTQAGYRDARQSARQTVGSPDRGNPVADGGRISKEGGGRPRDHEVRGRATTRRRKESIRGATAKPEGIAGPEAKEFAENKAGAGEAPGGAVLSQSEPLGVEQLQGGLPPSEAAGPMMARIRTIAAYLLLAPPSQRAEPKDAHDRTGGREASQVSCPPVKTGESRRHDTLQPVFNQNLTADTRRPLHVFHEAFAGMARDLQYPAEEGELLALKK